MCTTMERLQAIRGRQRPVIFNKFGGQLRGARRQVRDAWKARSRSRNVVIEFKDYDDRARLLQLAGIPGARSRCGSRTANADLIIIEGYDGPQPVSG